jgi:hypothetical protein
MTGTTEHEKNESVMARWSRNVGLLTVIIVVVNVVTAIIMWRQMDVMQGQLDESKTATQITQMQLKANLTKFAGVRCASSEFDDSTQASGASNFLSGDRRLPTQAPHPERHQRPLASEPLARDADSHQNDDKTDENLPGPRARMTSNLLGPALYPYFLSSLLRIVRTLFVHGRCSMAI